jgi:hypothetical protein
VHIHLEITDDQIKGLLCCAFEGGSNYWATIAKYDTGPHTFADFREGGKFQLPGCYWHPAQLIPLVDGCAVVVKEPDSNEEYRLDRAAIERGLLAMQAKVPRQFANLLNDNADADTGDAFLQCCLFGELVYG